MKNIFKVLFMICLISIVFSTTPPANTQPVYTQELSPVYIIPVRGVIDIGMQTFVSRAYAEAEASNAAVILLEIDTPGGFVGSAVEIRDTINRSSIPTIAFVDGGAISAGSLLALISENIVMTPGSTIGAAEPQRGGELADAKTLSYWTGQLEAAAEAHGRDTQVARAMADATVEIPEVTRAGELLTLTPGRALELGMIDHILPNRQAVLEEFGLTENPLVELEPEFGEFFVRWVTNPIVSTILLTVGFVGLILELFTPGFTIPGIVGLAALGIYFAGHMLAGLTGIEAILLFMLGIVLLAIEVLVLPGFGVAGIGGIIALAAGIVVASPSVTQGLSSLLVALIAAAVLVGVSLKFLPTRTRWKKLILGDSLTSEEGFNSISVELKDFLGLEGVALTPLRPAGTARIGEQRVDVVTQGEFITAESNVKVIKVEGTRVVVIKVEETEKIELDK